MNARDLTQAFADGDIASGEFLLARSGEKGDKSEFEIPALFATLADVLTTSTEEPKCCELAAGIVANLLLHNDINDICVEALNIPEFLYECCTVIDDPYTIAEILRGLTNLVYVGKSKCLHASLPTLASLMLYLAENSLSPKLLIHVVQLVYYMQAYCANELLLDWNSSWDAKSFYIHILGCDVGGVVSSADNEELYFTVRLLQGESVGDCTGLEWLLLLIDRITLSQSMHGHVLCKSEEMLSFVLHLLLSQSTQSWDTIISKPQSKSLGVSFNLSAAEKFLAVSILDSITGYRTDQTSDSQAGKSDLSVLHTAFAISTKYTIHTTECDGWMMLTKALLETLEDAVLMKDSYGLYASANLLNQIFESDEGQLDTARISGYPTISSQTTFLTEHMVILFSQVQNIVELLGITENTKWIQSHTDQDAEKANFIRFLLTVKNSLLCFIRALKTKGNENEKRVGGYASLVSTLEAVLAFL